MSLVATPEEDIVGNITDEFTVFSLTVTLDDVPGTPEPVPEGFPEPPLEETFMVEITSVDSPDSGLTITHTDTTFTVDGQFIEAFPRSLSYRDENNAIQTTDAFSKIPPNFNTLFKYIAPTATNVIKDIVVYLKYHSPFTYRINVRNNWQSANTKLKDYVAKGKF